MPHAELPDVSLAVKEKKRAAANSVFAALALTGMKLAVGLFSGSLGILAEAAHSGLDLVAAFITYLAVRVSDRPADEDHPYGHGKIENVSGVIEGLLIFFAAGWIVAESIHKLIDGTELTDLRLGVAVMPICVAGWKYSKILRQLPVSLAEPRWHSSTMIRSKKSLGYFSYRFGPSPGLESAWYRAKYTSRLLTALPLILCRACPIGAKVRSLARSIRKFRSDK